MDIFREALGEHDLERMAFLAAQDVEDEISEGVRLLGRLMTMQNMTKELKKTCRS